MSRRRLAAGPVAWLALQASAAASAALPPDAARLAARIEACVHFAGEVNGDRSARDREVARRMDALRCERVPRDVARMRRRYPRDAAVQRALDPASDL
jgi:hypothetical protein